MLLLKIIGSIMVGIGYGIVFIGETIRHLGIPIIGILISAVGLVFIMIGHWLRGPRRPGEI